MNARAAARVAGLLLLFVAVAPLHLVTRAVLRRSRWPSRFLAAAATIIGARVHVTGHPPGRHTLIVANHTSWLDILLLGGWLKSAFVSKEELGHGFIHWLADQNGTVYVSRTDRKGAKDQAAAIALALEGDQPITVFPEGTTGPGTHLLPFRSTLLEAPRLTGGRVQVRPVVITYGDARDDVAWFGAEAGKRNVIKILRRAGTMRITIHVLGPLDPNLDRKSLTQDAQDAIALTLGFKSSLHSPIDVGE